LKSSAHSLYTKAVLVVLDQNVEAHKSEIGWEQTNMELLFPCHCSFWL